MSIHIEDLGVDVSAQALLRQTLSSWQGGGAPGSMWMARAAAPLLAKAAAAKAAAATPAEAVPAPAPAPARRPRKPTGLAAVPLWAWIGGGVVVGLGGVYYLSRRRRS